MLTNLLKIDNQILAISSDPYNVFNISKHLDGHIIRKIIFNDSRFIILTATNVDSQVRPTYLKSFSNFSSNLYYMYARTTEPKLVDISDDISSVLNISDIKFITNSKGESSDFNIITNTNKVFMCEIVNGTSIDITQESFKDVNYIAISNKGIGCVCEQDNKKYIGSNDRYLRSSLYEINTLPTQFFVNDTILYGNKLIYSDETISTNVSKMYNKYYYVEDNNIRNVFGDNELMPYYSKHKVGNRKVLNITSALCITSTVAKQTKIIEFHHKNTTIEQIAIAHYHVENYDQYDNKAWNVTWCPSTNHLFDKYTNKFIKTILICYKYAKITKWIPKVVLWMIISFAL